MPPYNPFARRESHSATSIITHKVLIILSWLLLAVGSAYYTCHANGKAGRDHFWDHNRPTPFALNHIIVSIYWTVLFLLEIVYIWRLFSSNESYVNAGIGVGSYFILSNLLQLAFVMFFARSQFVFAELMLILNFFNLTFLYFNHNNHPWFIHVPVVSGPLAWTFVALYWNGAIAAHATGLAARILANVAIWSFLVYGLFFLVTYRDYTMGFALSVLTAAIGVQQFLIKIIALQWIFAFVIMGVLFVATVAVALPGVFGDRFTLRRERGEEPTAAADQERAPLLDEQ